MKGRSKTVFWGSVAALGVVIGGLNLFGGVVAGIWLAVLGEWGNIIRGLGLILVGGVLLSVVLMGSFVFAIAGAMALKRGKKTVGGVLGSGGLLYTVAVMTAWCLYVMRLFVRSATEGAVLPLLIWSYGVALAPWIWFAQKDQEGDGNQYSLVTLFFAEVSYIVAMGMFVVGTSWRAIGVVFGGMMLVGAILQLMVAFGREMRKVVAGKATREALAILGEARQIFASGAFDLVNEDVERMILCRGNEFVEAVAEGRSVRKYVLSVIANISGDMVESGKYHVYRGVLDPLGPGEELLKIFDWALDELVRLGDMDVESGEREKQAVRENVKDVG